MGYSGELHDAQPKTTYSPKAKKEQDDVMSTSLHKYGEAKTENQMMMFRELLWKFFSNCIVPNLSFGNKYSIQSEL